MTDSPHRAPADLPQADLPHADLPPADGPHGIACVALRVRDMDPMLAFYRDGLGLRVMGGTGATRRLGDGETVLLELRHDPSARARQPQGAGLFHTAFLLPDRAALGAWLRHAADRGLRLTGASDHGVSEALYLDDPEGNGVEIYRDRPVAEWPRDAGGLVMYSRRLDHGALAAAAQGAFAHAPRGTRIGHVHLQVGDVARAEGFLTDHLGLERQFATSGAAWLGWQGYHHHVAVNAWHSADAGPRAAATAGLDEVMVHGLAARATDPWCTAFSPA